MRTLAVGVVAATHMQARRSGRDEVAFSERHRAHATKHAEQSCFSLVGEQPLVLAHCQRVEPRVSANAVTWLELDRDHSFRIASPSQVLYLVFASGSENVEYSSHSSDAVGDDDGDVVEEERLDDAVPHALAPDDPLRPGEEMFYALLLQLLDDSRLLSELGDDDTPGQGQVPPKHSLIRQERVESKSTA